MIRKFIPNLFTLGNMASGSIAVILAVQNHLVYASIFVGIGIIFDFFDGFLARVLEVPSELGKELDSLADLITSGLVPGIVMVQLLYQSIGGNPEMGFFEWEKIPIFNIGMPTWALLGLLITLASGYRLAKFNIDERQTSSFIGLPTPANAILILSIPLILVYQYTPRIETIFLNRWFLIGLTLFSSFILNAELPLFGLKFSSWSLKENWYRYVFLIMAAVVVVYLQFIALPIIILIYLLFNIALYYLEEE